MNLKNVEKSIRNYGVVGALIGFILNILLAYPLATFLDIDTDACMKCQENGNIWIVIFIIGIPVLAFIGYLGMMHLRSFQLLRNGSVDKEQLLKMKRYDSLFNDHEF